MKALVVTPYYYPKIGGLENYARQLGIALMREKGWEVVVATSNHTGRSSFIDDADGMKVCRLGTWFRFSNTPVNPLWALQLHRIIRREKPDVILAHTPVPTMADAAAIARGRTPLVLFYHAATLKKGGSPLFNIVAWLYGRYEALTLGRATRIAAVSDFVRNSLPAKYQSKTVVVPNAVWSDSIVSRRQPEGAPNFVFISSLDKTHGWKGLELILEAVKEYAETYGSDITLTVIGGGNHRAVYESRARELGIAVNVRFLGALTGAAKDAEIRKATALIMYPTTANDAFPTVMLEAWSLGVPVAASAIGPIPSLIWNGQDGFLVEPHNPAKLAEKLHFVATMPATDRAAAADRAAARVRANYTWEIQADTVSGLADELIGRSTTPNLMEETQ